MKKVEEAQKTVDSAVFMISKVARAYFNTVIHVQDFILTVDSTGVYFFTNEENQETILIKLSNYIEQLSLEKGEFVACQITYEAAEISEDKFFELLPSSEDNETPIYQINPNTFETALRMLIRDRKVCFNDSAMQSIIDCFYDESFEKYTLGYYLSQEGFSLDRDKILELEDHPIITIEDVINSFGEDNAEEIYNAISAFRSLNAENYKRLFPQDNKYKKTSWDTAVKSATIWGALAGILAIILCVVNKPLLAIIFAFVGLLQGRHLHLIYKSVQATVITGLNLCTFIFSLIAIILGYKPEILAFLQNTLLISR